jgi:hypothetical protein
LREGTKAWAEAEAIDTELEGSTAAMEEALEEGFELEGAGDILLDFGELAGGEFFPARADGDVVAEATEEKLDFAESEAHVGGEADQEYAREGIARVMALSADALRRGEEASFFVVADGGGIEVSCAGELTDFHLRLPSQTQRGWNPLWFVPLS